MNTSNSPQPCGNGSTPTTETGLFPVLLCPSILEFSDSGRMKKAISAFNKMCHLRGGDGRDVVYPLLQNESTPTTVSKYPPQSSYLVVAVLWRMRLEKGHLCLKKIVSPLPLRFPIKQCTDCVCSHNNVSSANVKPTFDHEPPHAFEKQRTVQQTGRERIIKNSLILTGLQPQRYTIAN